jgi:hypothetical protein
MHGANLKMCIGCSLLQALRVATWLRIEVVNMTTGVAENIA